MQPTTFSRWIRSNLKDAYSGLIAHDIDYLIHFPATNRLYILEEKRRPNARTGPAQAVAYAALADLLRQVDDAELPQYSGCLLVYYHETRHAISTDPYGSDAATVSRFMERLANGQIDTSEEWFRRVIKDSLGFLWNCQGAPPYRKTEPERSARRFAPVIHSTDSHTISKIDWLFINYCSGLIAALNETPVDSSGAVLTAQFDKMMKKASALNQQTAHAVNPASGSVYRYIGYFELRYQATPSFSLSNITLNGISLTPEKLIRMLNLDDLEAWDEVLHS